METAFGFEWFDDAIENASFFPRSVFRSVLSRKSRCRTPSASASTARPYPVSEALVKFKKKSKTKDISKKKGEKRNAPILPPFAFLREILDGLIAPHSSFSEFYRISPSLKGFTVFLTALIDFYRVLPSFTELQDDLLGFQRFI